MDFIIGVIKFAAYFSLIVLAITVALIPIAIIVRKNDD